MVFQYYNKPPKVADDETGIELYEEGRPEVDQFSFIFFDPSATAKSHYGMGKFRIYATELSHVDKDAKKDGSVVTRVYLDGVQIDSRTLQIEFKPYTSGDSARFAKVCQLVVAGLKVWLEHRGAVSNPTVSIV